MRFLVKNDKIGILLLVFLGAIFTYLYFPQALIINEDINLITADDVDAGSIMGSIIGLFDAPYYSMFNGYHGKYYGWTYYVISAIFLAPIKLINFLFFNSNPTIDFLSIRIIFFIIGLTTIYFFFKLFDKISAKKERILVIFFLGLLMMPFQAGNLYWKIHPETTGILFLTLGILMLIRFTEFSDIKYYKYSIIYLVLASLAKQIFFFASLPVLVSFYVLLSVNQGVSFQKYIISPNFKKILLQSVGISILIFLIIHPYSIVHPINFIARQVHLLTDFQNGDLSFVPNLFKWISVLKGDIIMFVSFILVPLNLAYSYYFMFYRKINDTNGISKKLGILNVANCFAILFLFFMLVRGNNYVYSSHYFIPLNLFLHLNLFICILFLFQLKPTFLTLILRPAVYLFLAFHIYNYNFIPISNQLEKRSNYEASIAYKSFSYITELALLNNEVKIAYDHFASPPSTIKNLCFIWSECAGNNIIEFKPDYVIFNPFWTYLDKPHPPTELFKKYVSTNNMKLIKTFKEDNPRTTVYVYKSRIN